MFRSIVVALALLASCDGVFDVTKITKGPPDAGPDAPPDAPRPYDPCLPDATVPSAITIKGTMTDSSTQAPIASLDVHIMPGGDVVTDSGGAFSLPIGTGEQPLTATITATGQVEYPVHHLLFQRPFTQPTSDVSNRLFSFTTLDSFYQPNGARDPAKATALVRIRDCSNLGIVGAQLTLAAATKIVYQGSGTSTDTSGVAYALFITPGAISISATGTATFETSVAANEMLLVDLVVP